MQRVESSGSPANQDDILTRARTSGRFTPPEPGELSGRFPQLEVLSLLGQGGMGTVYKVRQRHLDRLAALKILPASVSPKDTSCERFVREAQSLAKLNHAHIVSVYDFGYTEDSHYYFVMEFIDGMDLRRLMQSGGLSGAETMTIIPQICDALQYAHGEGIVHRDIKPENILLNKKGQVKIADFGLAKLLGQPGTQYTLTHMGQNVGTPLYMAPEQIEHPNEVDHRADIYSLGVVFYEMLTGELPLGRFAPPSEKTHGDLRLDKVVLRALEKEPERRYQRAGDVKTAVERISSSGSAAASRDAEDHKGLGEVQRRIRGPATGLKIAGAINCVVALPLLLAWPVLAVTQGIGSAHTVLVVGGYGVTFAGIGLLTYAGVHKMICLQSYGLAVTTAMIQFLPSPGFIVGAGVGIWALAVLTSKDVHRAFIDVSDAEVVKAVGPVQKTTLYVLAVTASVTFLAALLAALLHGRFPLLPVLFGAPLVLLDLFAFGQWTGRPMRGPGLLWDRIKAETRGQEHNDAHRTRRMAAGSFLLGLLSAFLPCLRMAFTIRFTLIFLSAFFGLFLGTRAMKNTRPYREHLLDVGLVAGGIITATGAMLALFAGMM